MSKKSEKEAKKPDQFITLADKIGKWLSENGTPVFSVLAVIIIGAGAYYGYQTFQNYQQGQVAEELFSKGRPLLQKRESFSQLNQAAQQVKPGEPAPQKKADFEADYASLVEPYAEAILQRKNSAVALSHASQLASFLDGEKQTARAESLLSQVMESRGSKALLEALIWNQIGALRSRLDQWDQAIAALNKALEFKKNEDLTANTHLKLGLTYKAKSDLKLAREHFEKASSEFGSTEAGQKALTYLRYLDLKGGSSEGEISESN